MRARSRNEGSPGGGQLSWLVLLFALLVSTGCGSESAAIERSQEARRGIELLRQAIVSRKNQEPSWVPSGESLDALRNSLIRADSGLDRADFKLSVDKQGKATIVRIRCVGVYRSEPMDLELVVELDAEAQNTTDDKYMAKAVNSISP